VLVENRNGLIAAAMTTQADGMAERDAALLLLDGVRKREGRRITVGADKAYDTRDFVSTARELRVTPHVMQNATNRRSAIDRRTTHHRGYGISLVVRVQLRGVQPSADTKTAGAVCISAAKALTAALERRTTAPCGPALPIFSD